MSIRVDTGHESRPPQPGWIWLVALGIGFAAFLLVAELTGGNITSPTTTFPPEARTTTTTSATEDGPLTAPSTPELSRQVSRIAGFDGWLVSTVGVGRTRLEFTDGETQGSRDLPPGTGDTMRTDASGTLIAGLGGIDGRSLIVGRTTGDLYTVNLDATSFAWHRDAPGAIAWLESTEGTVRLLTSDVTPGSGVPMNTEAVLATGLDDPVLVGWDFERYVMETGDATVVTVDRTAVEQWRRPGTSAHLHGEGLVVIRGPSPAGVVFDFVSLESGELLDTWFFPDTVQAVASDPGRRLLAMTLADASAGREEDGEELVSTQLVVVDTETMAIAQSIRIPYRTWSPTWSHDGRFVLLAGTDDTENHVALAYDTMDESLATVAFSDWTRRVEGVERLARLFENG